MSVFSEKILSVILSSANHFSGSLTGESSSWQKYSFTPMLLASPKSATFITKLASILIIKKMVSRGERERERERERGRD